MSTSPQNNFPSLQHNTDCQYGGDEKPEYKWSSYFQEKILELSCHLTRTDCEIQQNIIGNTYNDLLQEVFLSNHLDCLTRKTYVSLLYRIMLQTRDIVEGEGEYKLFYILLGEWVKVSEQLHSVGSTKKDNIMHESTIECIDQLANKALESLVYLDGEPLPYGSWKDIKYFLTYLRGARTCGGVHTLPIFSYAIKMIIKQLRLDVCSETPSLLGKWLPREKSKKFGWLAKHIACSYYSRWLTSGINISTSDDHSVVLSNKFAERKCLTHYRKMIAGLNRVLKTVQINQCDNTWSKIDFDKSVTGITLSRQRKAFQYVNKGGELRGGNIDRLQCKENYETYIKTRMLGESKIKSDGDSMIDLVKDAIYIIENEKNSRKFGIPSDANDEMSEHIRAAKDEINIRWGDGGENIGALDNFVALIDTSGSMDGDPISAAIGLGCRIAENSKLGKRAITFSVKPKWIDLESTNSLTDMVEVLVSDNDWGMTTNFEEVMRLVLVACAEKRLIPDEVNNLVFVVFSDMKIDNADKECGERHDVIEKMFYDAGIESEWATPFTPPHIIYWNLHSTQKSPSLSFMKNISVLSGCNPLLLNSFCEKGAEALKDCTPWKSFTRQLEGERYMWVDDYLKDMSIFEVRTTSMVDEPAVDVLNDLQEDLIIPKTPSWWW